jgi:hypothetical protein
VVFVTGFMRTEQGIDMAFLNANERLALLEDLRKMTFRQAKWKLQKMDPKGRTAMYRNVQGVNRWLTRIDLVGLGTRVTLVEHKKDIDESGGRQKAEYELVEVIVEPTPENRT